MLFHTEYDYEELDEYYCLGITIRYYLHSEEKRTRTEPGHPAFIEIESVSIDRIEDSTGKIIKFPEEMMNKIREDVEKREWDVIIAEVLADQEEYLHDEYYDSKFNESRGC